MRPVSHEMDEQEHAEPTQYVNFMWEVMKSQMGSGAVTQFNPGVLAQKGSLFLTRPTLNTYSASREDLVMGAAELFSVVKSGKVRISINQTYPLRDAAQAQRDLESRKTTGSTVLLP